MSRPIRMLTAVAGICLALLLAGPSFASTPEAVDCDIQKAPCVRKTPSGLEVEFAILPRPVTVMQDLEFVVSLRKKGRPVTAASLVLDLSMPGMFMGNNQPKLIEEQGGRYRGRGVIPRCITGQRTWKAFVAVAHSGQVEKVSFLFEVQ